ncbi:DUF3667 domain-containing protein [Parvularcula sp. ZS-1/3]|uniref:DUF3667 domain-containing protein n=1 Tax=Parvularcula mediterranea TaxID=2732508 RepID=A0A7Y3W5V2_9PROT|nr:DUF3667 domain-containing protein [Parvularcula mediterranea]NNU16898.1 DUF3667 domain-containing protein [Parvularcula mediterranea]
MSTTEISAAAPEQSTPLPQGRGCLACGAEIVGPFCYNCGQKDDDCRRSITHLAGETVANVAALDGKFLRTFRWMLTRPGKHLHQYAHGKRSPFTPPVRFFFVVTFAFFATLWLTDTNIFVLQLVPEDQQEELDESLVLDFNVEAEGEEAPPAEEAAPVEKPQRTPRILSKEEVAEVEGEVRAALEDEGVEMPEFMERVFDGAAGRSPAGEDPAAQDNLAEAPPTDGEDRGEDATGPPATEEPADALAESQEESAEDLADAAEDAAEEAREAAAETEPEEEEAPGPRIVPYGGFFLKAQDLNYTEEEKQWLRDRVSLGEGVNFMGRQLTSERVGDALIMTMQNPNAFSNALNEAIPVLMLLFVPFMAVLGALIIRGRDALIYDHLLLSIQTHAFGFVILTIMLWFSGIVPDEIAGLAFMFGIPVYYALGLKGAFKRGWFKTVFTTIFVGMIYNFFMLIALFAAVAFSLWQIV